MLLLQAHNLGKSFGERTLFTGVSFDVYSGQHIGLVGPNGCGKTTVFKLLTHADDPSEGQIIVNREARIGYMQQHVDLYSDRTLYQEVVSVFAELIALEHEMETIAARIARAADHGMPAGQYDELTMASSSLLYRQHELGDLFEERGGYTYANRTRATLLGLGFNNSELDQPWGTLSGGQRSKALLAKILLADTNLLLLDEPTNHLDLNAMEWLEAFLTAYTGAFIVISHDRYFLDKVTTATWHLDRNRMFLYSGNYSRSLILKQEAKIAAERHYQNTSREIKRLEKIIVQQKQWNRERTIRTAESKQKAADRLKATLQAPSQASESLRIVFRPRRTGGNIVLTLDDVAKGYGPKQLFENVSWRVRKGDQIFLLGPNGCGKTTLLKIILTAAQTLDPEIPAPEAEAADGYSEPAVSADLFVLPDCGTVTLGANIEIGYFDQVQSTLHSAYTVLQEIMNAYPSLSPTQVRTALAAMLFKGDEVDKPVAALSGGERARLELTKLLLSGANFLLLDEPTNHLDIDAREALEEALLAFTGTLFVVSHDRYLINKLANQVWYFEAGRLKQSWGAYDAYVAARAAAKEASLSANSDSAPVPPPLPPAKADYQAQKEYMSRLRRLQTQISRTEAAINSLEIRLAALEHQLALPEVAADYVQTSEIGEAMVTVRAELETCYTRWENLTLQHDELTRVLS